MISNIPSTAPCEPATMPTSAWRSEKIAPEHLDRLAIVYVRQSSPQQVLNHQESTRLQYNLKTRALQFGWPEGQVLVIDDDLGKSGATAEGRLGFQRLVSEVGLGNVGMILGIEMSRLARSCKDWHQLLEVCAIFGTLIADLDGIYDPAHYNDRLLLGLKGTMSEAELHILKQRMYEGKINKARRGDLAFPVPLGYARRPSGEVVMDPDEQARSVVKLVFRKFDELLTVNAVLSYFVDHDIQLGFRIQNGPGRGELEWRRPNRGTLTVMLHNPIYAGAYAFGRSLTDPRRKKPGSRWAGQVTRAPEEWLVLLKDRFPAYITWEQYETNVARMKANRSRWDAPGAPRRGAALLSGLLSCAKCGARMTVHYGPHDRRHVYICSRQKTDYGDDVCQRVTGSVIDAFVRDRVLDALAPASLELSLEATKNLERERAELATLWQQRLERAQYEADRAARQYRLVEPENRLVARQLERDWEEKLAEFKRLEEEHRRFEHNQPRRLSESEREAIRRLAADIPALWNAPTTTDAERKEILRQVVDRVVADNLDASERVRVEIRWIGGSKTEGEMTRPIGRFERLSNYEQLCGRVRALVAQGLNAGAIAERLNAEGFRMPKHGSNFTADTVRRFKRSLGLIQPRRRTSTRDGLGPNEWWVQELAPRIGMSEVTLYKWLRQSRVKARQEAKPLGRWIIWADPAEIERLREIFQRGQGYTTRQQWIDMRKGIRGTTGNEGA